MSDKAVEIVVWLAELLAERGWTSSHSLKKLAVAQLAFETERILEEAGLVELIEAGQAMRERVGAPPYGASAGANWDAALAKLGGRT